MATSGFRFEGFGLRAQSRTYYFKWAVPFHNTAQMRDRPLALPYHELGWPAAESSIMSA
jgi:hypothetical protein